MPESQTAWKSDNQGVKETFIQISRRGSRAERMGGKAEDCRWGGACWLGSPTFTAGYVGRNNWGARQTAKPRVSAAVKIYGSKGVGKTSSITRESVYWRGPQGLRTYANPPTCKSSPERAQSACGYEGSDRKWEESLASNSVLSLTPSPQTAAMQQRGLPCPGK